MVIDVRVSPSALILRCGVLRVLATALVKLVLRCNNTMSNMLHAEVCLFFCCGLASWAILTAIYNPGNVDHDLYIFYHALQGAFSNDSLCLLITYKVHL